ncbi:probable histone-arginine methyltransferase 1.4 isoform X1 [Hevea brasiliensis]|uniref:probable histone-arginine methyltransferase 1.4 isoform X1 n=1 Tax=Hevea brasiliensis TaxID=3981 RepID=UPI0025DAAFE5|nr:probable histone-arginine methyltransferase 1.4 isoform X1 [Hevea brasiliensis]XP_058000951.1 probable histone-arginine methyltransferase 1.4 isoform X1 [Hevea brasiliensis]XP_058000952.1 probable histone-arginine methyltransferase 1.4 isoform X1 [Hevea brasiliensis]
MEVSAGQKQNKHQQFALASITDLYPSSPSSSLASPVVARFSADNGVEELRFLHESDAADFINVDLSTAQLFKLGPDRSVCIYEGSASDISKEKYSRGITIQFRNEEESRAFHCAFEQWKKEVIVQGITLPNGAVTDHKSKFDNKIEASSAKMYFHYYGQLLHQQNMLQDYVRTGTYYAAVIENRADFFGRVVVDVGAGSGILSLFAAQAGAKHVYAVEASEMAEYARRLIAGNPSLGERITVIKGKVEEVELPEKADILISEPMGTLLVNERMLESYVIARDRFLLPNGKMFPTVGRMHMAPFSDEYLFIEIANKALFWQQQNYYGVDLTPLYGSAFQGYFSQPVVDAFDPRLLVAPAIFHVIDFTEIKEEELYEIDIPLKFIASVGTRVHGLACWFDVLFNGSTVQRWLTTAPGAPTTHWYQLRCVLSQPLYVMAGQEITGRLRMVAHNAQSYTIYLTLSAKMWGPGAEQGGILQTSSCKLDLKEPYYRMSQPQAYAMAQDQQPHQLIHAQRLHQPSENLKRQVLSMKLEDVHIQSEDLEEPELIQPPSQNLEAQL